MTDLSAMAWEPCILKHGAHYDDPYLHMMYDDSVEHPKKKKTVVTFLDGETRQYPSIASAARDVGFDGKTINLYNVRVFCRRMGATIECVQ